MRTGGIYRFKLFVTGMSITSVRAIENIKRICEKYIPNNYELEIIDIHKNPTTLTEYDIIACPTLVKLSPGDLKKMLGDLSNEDKVLSGLGILKEGRERNIN
ncbi:MAG: circadian clock protein KaiB [Bacteroidota bacterium]|jgi:circadian clock protein KaiB|nr:circadian clock protein KaiB [Bacteroidota bacterium]